MNLAALKEDSGPKRSTFRHVSVRKAPPTAFQNFRSCLQLTNIPNHWRFWSTVLVALQEDTRMSPAHTWTSSLSNTHQLTHRDFSFPSISLLGFANLSSIHESDSLSMMVLNLLCVYWQITLNWSGRTQGWCNFNDRGLNISFFVGLINALFTLAHARNSGLE